MRLSKYKEKTNCNIVDLAERFGVTHQTMYSWIKDDNVRINGKQGERVITVQKTKTVKERPLEKAENA